MGLLGSLGYDVERFAVLGYCARLLVAAPISAGWTMRRRRRNDTHLD